MKKGKAYCLYRQNKLDEALDALKGQVRSDETMLLESQILYCLGKMDASLDIYQKLQKSKIDSLEINFVASLVMTGREKYTDAEQLLLSGRRCCGSLYSIIRRDLADESSIAVAVNNLISLKGPKDVSDSLRKLGRLKEKETKNFELARGLDLKLLVKQKEAIYSNRVLLLLHANKLDQARELVSRLPEMIPESVVPVMLQAALLVREIKAGRAEEILAQFAAAASHPHTAVDSLAKILDIQHMHAIVATLVSLKEHVGDIDGAAAMLDSTIKWWSNAMTESNKLNIIIQEATSFKLKHGKEEEDARLYEDLFKSQGNIEALVGLVTTVACLDVNKAELYEMKLKTLPGLKGIDVDSLERTSGVKQVDAPRVAFTQTQEEGKNKAKAMKKRKRKPKYPKGFDPAKPGPPPDPEKWLPKRERSTYWHKRKDKRAAQVRGSQGAVVREKHNVATSSNNSNPKSNQATGFKGAAAVSEQSKPSSNSSKKKSRK
ncbi:hypothetical protein TanjilG_22671 [Lupinus angustifolius]|uniref:Signal recognition particle subunit SRP72 n=1 Tax=Lupinus angustifolius TaxID=3871 RepID=A0A1J7I1L6_LUPAN|nr:hypothetical protein TanjilG_22671 [Lupinus angustifolius]